jgi:hypothetical protein
MSEPLPEVYLPLLFLTMSTENRLIGFYIGMSFALGGLAPVCGVRGCQMGEAK